MRMMKRSLEEIKEILHSFTTDEDRISRESARLYEIIIREAKASERASEMALSLEEKKPTIPDEREVKFYIDKIQEEEVLCLNFVVGLNLQEENDVVKHLQKMGCTKGLEPIWKATCEMVRLASINPNYWISYEKFHPQIAKACLDEFVAGGIKEFSGYTETTYFEFREDKNGIFYDQHEIIMHETRRDGSNHILTKEAVNERFLYRWPENHTFFSKKRQKTIIELLCSIKNHYGHFPTEIEIMIIMQILSLHKTVR